MYVLNHTGIKLFFHKMLPLLYICIDVSTSSRNHFKHLVYYFHVCCYWSKQKSPNSSALRRDFSQKIYLNKHKAMLHYLHVILFSVNGS